MGQLFKVKLKLLHQLILVITIATGAHAMTGSNQIKEDCPLNLAVKRSDIQLIKKLLKEGCQADGNGKVNPLHTAIKMIYESKDLKFDSTIAQVLIDGGANPNGAKNLESPMNLAVRMGSLEAVQFLIKNKADVHQKGLYNQSMAIIGGYSDRWQVVELLLQHGVDANEPQTNGVTLAKIAYTSRIRPETEDGKALARVKAKIPTYVPSEAELDMQLKSSLFNAAWKKGLSQNEAETYALKILKQLKDLAPDLKKKKVQAEIDKMR